MRCIADTLNYFFPVNNYSSNGQFCDKHENNTKIRDFTTTLTLLNLFLCKNCVPLNVYLCTKNTPTNIGLKFHRTSIPKFFSFWRNMKINGKYRVCFSFTQTHHGTVHQTFLDCLSTNISQTCHDYKDDCPLTFLYQCVWPWPFRKVTGSTFRKNEQFQFVKNYRSDLDDICYEYDIQQKNLMQVGFKRIFL